LFTFLNDYYKQQESKSQKSEHSSDEESNHDPASGSKSKDDKSNLEEIIDEKQSPGHGENFLSSMSRDGLRGPYGMTMNYDEDTTANKYRPINSQM
jgi:imidazole glycerol phosphate synthase subunit HisF